MPRRSIVATVTVASAVLLVVACTGGPGSLGTFGDDGLEGQDQQQTSSSSGRTTSSSTSTSSTSSTGGSTTSSTSSSSGTPVVDAGQRYSCGTNGLTCSPSQYCVTPCCTQKTCYALDSGSTCPAGYSYNYCATAGAYGCVPNPCTPPSPYCTSSLSGLPAGCSPSAADSRKVNCTCQ